MVVNKCKICNKTMNKVTAKHIKARHKMTVQQYKKKYGRLNKRPHGGYTNTYVKGESVIAVDD